VPTIHDVPGTVGTLRFAHPTAFLRQIGTTGKSRAYLSSPQVKNISLYRNSDLRYQSPSRAHLRDVSRSSRYVGRRMRWTLWRQADLSPDETFAADGEVVWFWRRDPGATSVGSFPPATGARKAASPGRARISRKTIARGKPGCLGCTCQTRVLSHLLSHTALRVHPAPGFPCALSRREGQRIGKAQAKSRRENEQLCQRCCCGPSFETPRKRGSSG
jgi:hypothetical protein